MGCLEYPFGHEKMHSKAPKGHFFERFLRKISWLAWSDPGETRPTRRPRRNPEKAPRKLPSKDIEYANRLCEIHKNQCSPALYTLLYTSPCK